MAELYQLRTVEEPVYIHTYQCDCGTAWRSNRPTHDPEAISMCPTCDEEHMPADTDVTGIPHKSGTVVALPGMGAPPNEADPAIVSLIEDALAEAKAGQLIGVAIASARHDGSVASGYQHLGGGRILLGGALMKLYARVLASFND